MINASSPPKPQVAVPASPVMRPEDHLTPALGSMKLATPAKSPLKPGLDVRNMKFPAGKRDDDAISNAPSIAMSRMSMLSTLDDSLKLSDMYKQMTARLEGEKHDLLKVVASQAQEIAQMKKHIMSLELQLKKSRPQGA
ncbi:RNA-binding protein [Phytophthora megakarya]|uniref:RNA-binding protein n=1 Tax=Phytophthora megakarya TaxID=4795 RepID=A0A225VSQ7_9STRA|nr:RNA-binding protein [Phytophthora megakarya]